MSRPRDSKFLDRLAAAVIATLLFVGVAYNQGLIGDPVQSILSFVSGEPPLNPHWRSALPRLEESERDAIATIDGQLAPIDAVFADAKKGVRPFVDAVFDLEGRLNYGGQLLEEGAGFAARFINDVSVEVFGGEKVFDYTGPSGDRFADYVREQFDKRVLDPATLRRAAASAVAGYGGELEAIEGKLLVDLRADLPDGQVDTTDLLPKLKLDAPELVSLEGTMGEIMAAAGTDFGVAVAKIIVGEILGDLVAGQITDAKDTSGQKLAISASVGMLTGKLLDFGMESAGYTPQQKLAARVDLALDRMRSLLIEGDASAVKNYLTLGRYRDAHPDPSVRDACRRATELMEQRCHLGLRRSLESLERKRAEQRRTALYRHITGESTPPLPALGGEDRMTPDQITDLARQCASYYGAN